MHKPCISIKCITEIFTPLKYENQSFKAQKFVECSWLPSKPGVMFNICDNKERCFFHMKVYISIFRKYRNETFLPVQLTSTKIEVILCIATYKATFFSGSN